MIIGLSGYAQSGKDEVAKILVKEYGFKRIAFADKIREFLYELDPGVLLDVPGTEQQITVGLQNLVEEVGWDWAKQYPSVRSLLQNVGVAARSVFHEDFWVIEAFKQFGPKDNNYVITDVRFKNEAATIQRLSLDGELWRINRPGINPVNNHVSENDLDQFLFDATIVNDGSIEDLHKKVHELMEDVHVN